MGNGKNSHKAVLVCQSSVSFVLSRGDVLDLCFLGISIQQENKFYIRPFLKKQIDEHLLWNFIQDTESSEHYLFDGLHFCIRRNIPENFSLWRDLTNTEYSRKWLRSRNTIKIQVVKHLSSDCDFLDAVVRKLDDFSSVLENFDAIQDKVTEIAKGLSIKKSTQTNDIVIYDNSQSRSAIKKKEYVMLKGEPVWVSHEGIIEVHGKKYPVLKAFRDQQLYVQFLDNRLFVYDDDTLIATYSEDSVLS